MKKYFSIILFLVLTVICLSGCFYDLLIPESDLDSEDTENGVVPGKGTLKIYLTDSSGNYKENDPGTYSAVYITIYKIEAHIAEGNDEGNDGGNDEGNDEGNEPWKVLKEWPDGLEVDLIKLEDRSMLLASLELESKKYTQLRLFLIDGEEEDDWIAWIVLGESRESNELEEPEPIPLEIPSVYQTGIKLNRPFEIVTDSITKLTIDFDAEKSVVKTGNGKYKLKPVINVTSEIYSEGDIDTGTVSGTVSYDGGDLGLIGISEASVSLSGGEYIFVYNATTSEVGSFEFLENVPIGNCVLNVYADAFNDHSESIVVEDGEDTVVDVVLSFEETGVISGTVSYYDSLSTELEGIDGASVELSGGEYIFVYNDTTSGGGSFSFNDVPVGNCVLNVYAGGFDDYSESIEVKVDEDTVVNVVFLLEEPGVISGIVVDSDSGDLIEGATVTATLSSSAYTFEKFIVTGEDGLIFMDQLPVGTYTLNVLKEGYVEEIVIDIVVESAETYNISISLTPETPE